MISVATLQAAAPQMTVGYQTAELARMLAAALAFVEMQTGRYFGPVEEVSAVLPGSGTHHLRLRDLVVSDLDYPVLAVIERARPGATAVVVSGTELRTSRRMHTLARTDGGVWQHGYEYEITYTRGWETDEGPADVGQLLIDLVTLRINLAGRGALRSETIGGYSWTRYGESDLDAIPGGWATIKAWRLPVWVT